MKLIFLGTGSAFTVGQGNFHSNMLIQTNEQKNLLIDCGSDARHALHEQRIPFQEIDGVYISHLHADHVGGLEWLAFRTYHEGFQKPKLYLSNDLVDDLWDHVLSGGLHPQSEFLANLSTYFQVFPVGDTRCFEWEEINFQLVRTKHYKSVYHLCPSYGLYFSLHGKKVFITTDACLSDSLRPFYSDADLIFQDCETSLVPSGVHAHYIELRNLEPEIKNKMWLYHYNDGDLPDAKKDGFLGYVQKGQTFIFD